MNTKVTGNGKWNLHHLNSKLSFTIWLEKKKNSLPLVERLFPSVLLSRFWPKQASLQYQFCLVDSNIVITVKIRESFYRQLSTGNFYSYEHVSVGCCIAKSRQLHLPLLSSSESSSHCDVVCLKIVLATRDSYCIVSR